LKTSRDSIVNATNCGFNEGNTGIGECDVVVAAIEPQRGVASTQMWLRRHARTDRRMRSLSQQAIATQKPELGTQN
jgi:hypothetical protein